MTTHCYTTPHINYYDQDTSFITKSTDYEKIAHYSKIADANPNLRQDAINCDMTVEEFVLDAWPVKRYVPSS